MSYPEKWKCPYSTTWRSWRRIFYSLIAVAVGAVGCFIFVKPLVQVLEVPAQGVKFLQLAPGEFFFVSLKVAGYSGILVASPVILLQIILFVLPGLTRCERRLIVPVVLRIECLIFCWFIFCLYCPDSRRFKLFCELWGGSGRTSFGRSALF
jgi:Sec-independent protein secretion pathway component TatC